VRLCVCVSVTWRDGGKEFPIFAPRNFWTLPIKRGAEVIYRGNVKSLALRIPLALLLPTPHTYKPWSAGRLPFGSIPILDATSGSVLNRYRKINNRLHPELFTIKRTTFSPASPEISHS